MPKILPLIIVLACYGSASAEAIGELARKNGVRKFQKTLEDVAQFLTKDSTYSALSVWNKENADAHIFNSQISFKYSDGNSVAIVNVAPTGSGKCDATYTSVFPTEKSCSVTRETDFKDWNFNVESAGLVVLKNNSGLNTILLPMGTGCVAIKTEVLYP